MEPVKEILVAHQELTELCVRKLTGAGVRPEDATITAEVLVHANLRGVDSHGVLRMEHYVNKLVHGGIHPSPDIRTRRTGPATAIVDGGDGLGHVVARKAMEEAIRLAEESGTGMVGAVNSSHCGALSYFVKMAADRRLIGLVMSNTDKGVVPFGGKSMFFGTNPIAFGFPARRHPPIILDMATSTVAYGKVLDYRLRGKRIPPDWAVDEEGRSVTDPELARAMLHFGGAKGFGLALAVDMFSSVLLGAAFGPHVVPMYGGDPGERRKLGQFFCAVNPSWFTNIDEFLEQTDRMIDELHQVPAAEGFEAVLVPGEPEQRRERQRRRDGIPVPEPCLAYLRN